MKTIHEVVGYYFEGNSYCPDCFEGYYRETYGADWREVMNEALDQGGGVIYTDTEFDYNPFCADCWRFIDVVENDTRPYFEDDTEWEERRDKDGDKYYTKKFFTTDGETVTVAVCWNRAFIVEDGNPIGSPIYTIHWDGSITLHFLHGYYRFWTEQIEMMMEKSEELQEIVL